MFIPKFQGFKNTRDSLLQLLKMLLEKLRRISSAPGIDGPELIPLNSLNLPSPVIINRVVVVFHLCQFFARLQDILVKGTQTLRLDPLPGRAAFVLCYWRVGEPLKQNLGHQGGAMVNLDKRRVEKRTNLI